MTRHRRLIIILALFLSAGAFAYLATGWWNSSHSASVEKPGAPPVASAPVAPAAPAPREEVVVESPTLKRTEGGRLAWQVQLTQLKIAAGSNAVAAVGMREGLIYDQTGVPVIRLSANTVRGNTANRDLEVAGNVRAVSQRGALITTEQVRWLEKERRLYCPQKVTFRSSNAAVTTTGLSYYVDQDVVKAPGVVRLYSGENKLVGNNLTYNIKTQAFEMKNVQAVFNPQQARQLGRPQ